MFKRGTDRRRHWHRTSGSSGNKVKQSQLICRKFLAFSCWFTVLSGADHMIILSITQPAKGNFCLVFSLSPLLLATVLRNTLFPPLSLVFIPPDINIHPPPAPTCTHAAYSGHLNQFLHCQIIAPMVGFCNKCGDCQKVGKSRGFRSYNNQKTD